MKRFTYLVTIAIIVAAGACKKGAVDPAHPLIGTWKVVANFISPGGPGSWINVPANSNNYAQFDAGGNIKGNVFTGYSTYAYKDSVTLTFTGANITAENYYYKISHDTLTLGPAGPIFCFEGCATRFIREK
jgi:hypothetical protein